MSNKNYTSSGFIIQNRGVQSDMLSTYLGQILIGWLFADLLSGIVHWLEDRILRMDTPILGKAVVIPNRVHHTDQLAFTRSTFKSRNEWLWLVVALISIPLWFLPVPTALWAAMTLGGLLVNEVHRLAHRSALAGPLVKTLQEIGIIQSPRHHSGHHRTPTDTRYCILTDWLNPVLDRIQLWTALERLLEWFNLKPNRGTA